MKKTLLLQLGLTVVSAIALIVAAFNNTFYMVANLFLIATLLVSSYNYKTDNKNTKAYIFLSFAVALATLIILELFGVI